VWRTAFARAGVEFCLWGRLYWQTEAWSGEYDVVKCPKESPPSECIQEITSHFQVQDMLNDCPLRQNPSCTGPRKNGINLIYAGGHCHAPSCLSMELYNADTGDLLCRQVPVVGQSTQIFGEGA
jgi:hypothetical protein